MKTGVQAVLKGMKILDSGFRRNDGEKTQANFFTAWGEGRVGVMFLKKFMQRLGYLYLSNVMVTIARQHNL